jgi:hypothetical protein
VSRGIEVHLAPAILWRDRRSLRRTFEAGRTDADLGHLPRAFAGQRKILNRPPLPLPPLKCLTREIRNVLECMPLLVIKEKELRRFRTEPIPKLGGGGAWVCFADRKAMESSARSTLCGAAASRHGSKRLRTAGPSAPASIAGGVRDDLAFAHWPEWSRCEGGHRLGA